MERARHIEVQILGDGKNVVHCYERECSLQRRRQKVWEEAPSLALPPEARERLCASAVAIAKAVSYRGAGTVEFLFDEETGAYYFLEVNTRIQVEHPVTEMITGVDLVAEMFRIAGGEPLSVRQADIAVSGHAIECRINAEDPFHDFMPGPGVIGRLVMPDADGVRFDTMLYEGYGVPPFYDSLLGKLVVHGADRRDCLARLRKALAGLVIEGVPPRFRCIRRWPTTRRSREPLSTPASSKAGSEASLRLRPPASRSLPHEPALFVRRRRAPVRRVQRGNVARRVLHEPFAFDGVKAAGVRGVTEICPANASMQVKFDPDVIGPDDLLKEVQASRRRPSAPNPCSRRASSRSRSTTTTPGRTKR